MHERFISIKPSENLRPYISYYYFHQCSNPDFHKEFIYYPHYKNALTVAIQETSSYKILFSRFYTQSPKVVINGAIDKLGVVFNPLGLNHFINGNFSEIITENVTPFSVFGKPFEETLDKVYYTVDLTEKAGLLDEFFTTHLIGFREIRIQQAVNLLLSNEGEITIQAMADNLAISRKTLLRLFQRHLGCSVETYRKLVKFRSTLDYMNSMQNENLSEVNYHYYDQADFIKQFKSLTRLSPKVLSESLTHLGTEDTFWNFTR